MLDDPPISIQPADAWQPNHLRIVPKNPEKIKSFRIWSHNNRKSGAGLMQQYITVSKTAISMVDNRLLALLLGGKNLVQNRLQIGHGMTMPGDFSRSVDNKGMGNTPLTKGLHILVANNAG